MANVPQSSSTDELLKELLSRQLQKTPVNKKLQYQDLKRISKYIITSPFDENSCCLWKGYITNTNNSNKGIYINFFFKGHKIALHRLLYMNFIGDLDNNEYLKFTCDNKGKCCNIMHLKKFKYFKDPKNNVKTDKIKLEKLIPEKEQIKNTRTSLIVSFD